MGKTTKRARKFAAKGGPKGMLQKGGTITKKGKFKLRKNGANNNAPLTKEEKARMELRQEMNLMKERQEKNEIEEKRERDDFVGEENLGDLDLDKFLENVTNSENNEDGNGGGDDDESDDFDDMEVEKNNIDEDDEEDDGESGEASDDEEDDETEQDIEAAEEQMREEMKKLAQSDPDFHKYLQDNESSLLDFQGDDDDGGDDDLEEDEEGEDDNDDDNEIVKKKQTKTIVDAKMLKSLEKGSFQSHGVKSLRKLISVYVAACHMADSNNEASKEKGSTKAYHIESSTVFDKLMVTCLTKCHEEFHYHLLGKGSSRQQSKNDDDDDDEEMEVDASNEGESSLDKPINPKQVTKSIRWDQLKTSIQSFFKATLHLVTEAKENKLLHFIVKSLENYIPYLSLFPRLSKTVLKSMTSLWSTTSDSSKDYETVRLTAFLRIRQLALTQPFPFIENCLKATYLAYAKSAKFANAATVTSLLPTLTFMGNCVVELYSLDYASSYQHAFIYIRQLALHLRTALQKKTPESFRVVYCWQYMHCLKMWTAVLSATCSKASEANDDDEMALMRSLIYPLVEIIFGVARLIPTTRHLPLRLHCVRYLQQLAGASEMFIPTTSLLLDVFDLKEVTMTPKRVKNRGNDVRGVRLPLILKLPKNDALRTSEQLDACFGEIFLLLNREVDLYRYSAGFPEFTVRICQKLRKVRTVQVV